VSLPTFVFNTEETIIEKSPIVETLDAPSIAMDATVLLDDSPVDPKALTIPDNAKEQSMEAISNFLIPTVPLKDRQIETFLDQSKKEPVETLEAEPIATNVTVNLGDKSDISESKTIEEIFTDSPTVPMQVTQPLAERPTLSEKRANTETTEKNTTLRVSATNHETKKKKKAALSTANYQIQKLINKGGMGLIYKGVQNSLQREIAIKTLFKDLTPKEKEKKTEKFLAEAMVTAFLDHPNIVPVHDLGQNEEGEIMLAMKLVGGASWKELLHDKQDKKYDLEGHLGILINVCNAIAFAHSKGIVHADLKPDNIMVEEFGEVLVMDWGIAVDIKPQEGRKVIALSKSMVKSPMGTPNYMPSELAEDEVKI